MDKSNRLPRIRQSDGAVHVAGVGYVHQLHTYGGREGAAEAARQAIKQGQKLRMKGRAA